MSTATERPLAATLDSQVLMAIVAWVERYPNQQGAADRYGIAHDLGIDRTVLAGACWRLARLGLLIAEQGRWLTRDPRPSLMGRRVCLLLSALADWDRPSGVGVVWLSTHPFVDGLQRVGESLAWMAEHGFCWEVTPGRYRAVGGL